MEIRMIKSISRFVIAIFVLFGMRVVALSQDNLEDLKNDIEELRREQKVINDNIKNIYELLIKMPKPPSSETNVQDVEFEIGNNPIIGDDNAPLVIVEFTDYQCQFCARHAQQTYPQIAEKYINTGKIRYVIIDHPIPSHNMAQKAAEASHCAAEQGKFWMMHDKMMDNQEKIDEISSIASSIQLNMNKFNNCLETSKYADEVGKDHSLAMKLNIRSVPGFVIASKVTNNPLQVKGISYIRGAASFDNFQQEIDRALADISK